MPTTRTCRLLAILVLCTGLSAADVSSFTLVNADSDSDIGPLADGAVLDLASLPTRNLSVRANVTNGTPSKVNFTLSGAESHTQSEGVAPYALFGDSSGDYNPWTPSLGSYSLSANADGSGALTVGFTVEDGGSGGGGGGTGTGTDGDGSVTISGTTKRWHKVTLTLDGPWASETGEPNPFTDYRMTVTFTNGSLSYQVPGYFAADGSAAETSATSGTKWRAHLSPDLTGTWTYSVDFRSGGNVAVDGGGTELAPYDGKSGSFTVGETDKTGRDFRAHGRLQYVGERYLRFKGSGERFIKVGADAPEVLLGYEGFDNTTTARTAIKDYDPHLGDWQSGDPTWQGGKGKGIIGVVNYLAGEGMNVISFLPYNAGGDGKNVWPYRATSHDAVDDGDEQQRFDCSKLDQWEILFEHATRKGVFLHFKTQETENDNNSSYALDGGALGLERKLYYRELIARYAHHLALNWNLGEENTNTDAERKAFAAYFKTNDPYGHHRVLHTYPGQQDAVYDPLLGTASDYTGPSIQTGWSKVHSDTLRWIQDSAAAGKQWAVANDEQGSASDGIVPDPGYPGYGGGGPSHAQLRHQTLWGNLMAGGWGVEAYFGYSHPHSDLSCEDFRSRDQWWDYCRHAKTFFDQHLPFHQMSSNDALVGNGSSSNGGAYCLAKVGEVYACYFPTGSGSLDLSGVSGTFTVAWFDPRNGGALENGSVTSVSGGGNRNLGTPPNASGSDWAVLVTKSGSTPVNQPPVAQASATPTSGTAPLTVGFSSAGSSDSDGTIVGRSWSFGDGGSSTAAAPSHTYSAPGTYTATLTVTDDDGATASDSVTITVSSAPAGQSPYGGSPIAVAASGVTRIQAEDYDLGGEGVAYHDVDASNNGGKYRTDAVDIQSTGDTGGGFNVGWIAGGEWLEYTVDVAAAGSFQVDLRVARQPSGSSALHLELGGSDLSGSVDVPSTGGWQTWTTVTTQIDLPAGQQVLRLAMDGSSFNVNWLDFTPIDTGGGVVAAINAGGGAYTAVDGTAYAADGSVSGGKTYSSSASIAGTEDDALYRSERYGNFSYAIPVADGDYTLTLQFAEIYWTADGKRVFDVIVEGSQVVSDLDIHAVAGGKDIAYDLVVPVSVSDGQLDLVFSTDVNNAKLSALRLETASTVTQ